jgi:hypothetical protein
MDCPPPELPIPSGRLLLLPLFHGSPETSYNAITPIFSSSSMVPFSQSVHILSENIPVAFHVDPSTVATAIEVSVLNDMMVDDPLICDPLLNALSNSWQHESLSCGLLFEACRNVSFSWVQRPSLFDAAVVILAKSASLEQWNCAQKCLSSIKLALGCQILLITDADFPSGPIRPSSKFDTAPTLSASLTLSPLLSFPPSDYVLSHPFFNIFSVVSSESATKYTK